jgi:hypothetical protein
MERKQGFVALHEMKQGFVALHEILVKKTFSLPRLSHSISKRHLWVCEITFCLKVRFGIMMTPAPIYSTFVSWLGQKSNM